MDASVPATPGGGKPTCLKGAVAACCSASCRFARGNLDPVTRPLLLLPSPCIVQICGGSVTGERRGCTLRTTLASARNPARRQRYPTERAPAPAPLQDRSLEGRLCVNARNRAALSTSCTLPSLSCSLSLCFAPCLMGCTTSLHESCRQAVDCTQRVNARKCGFLFLPGLCWASQHTIVCTCNIPNLIDVSSLGLEPQQCLQACPLPTTL